MDMQKKYKFILDPICNKFVHTRNVHLWPNLGHPRKNLTLLLSSEEERREGVYERQKMNIVDRKWPLFFSGRNKGCGSKSVYLPILAILWKYTDLLPHPLIICYLKKQFSFEIWQLFNWLVSWFLVLYDSNCDFPCLTKVYNYSCTFI